MNNPWKFESSRPHQTVSEGTKKHLPGLLGAGRCTVLRSFGSARIKAWARDHWIGRLSALNSLVVSVWFFLAALGERVMRDVRLIGP